MRAQAIPPVTFQHYIWNSCEYRVDTVVDIRADVEKRFSSTGVSTHLEVQIYTASRDVETSINMLTAAISTTNLLIIEYGKAVAVEGVK